jgi:hypothetical protein
MDEENVLERLKTTPIVELNLGEARLRRVIKRAGFESLTDVLELSVKEIDDKFEWDEADKIISMQNRYREDPEGFASSVLKKREIDHHQVEQRLEKHTAQKTKVPKCTAVTAIPRVIFSSDEPRSLPPMPFSDILRGYEKRARDVFDDLDDRYNDVMVYQAFDEFATELDEISDAFGSLFRYYSNQPRAALGVIDRHLRNAFIVYVADRARKVYSEGNLWGNFFDDLNMEDSNVQSVFKQTFAGQIERRKMPLYARDDATNYYFYTALLHGGLSGDFWENLWQKSLLPLAHEIASGYYGFGDEMDGHAILKEIKNPESRFAPKKTVLNVLEKAPDSTIVPLFEASMKVAAQVESSKQNRSEYIMLSNFGLPDLAMQALRDSQERKAARSQNTGRAKSSSKDQGSRLVYLPMATLQLDLTFGIVCMRWSRQQFPLRFAGHRIDYYVDGKCAFSQPFQIGVGKCLLEPVEISVAPQARYDVELKMMQVDDDGAAVEKSSLQQTFTRSKPGCFEFIKDLKGMFRLRGRNERINKKRRIAYMVKPGLGIEPGPGMQAVSEYDTSGDWDDARIFIYDVEPGASGSLIDEKSGVEVAVWQERYSAKIDKRRIIGETTDGLDLYGYVPNKLGTNGGLPSISIEAMDGLAALNDLEIFCDCDGTRISIPRRLLWSDEVGESMAAQIALVPQESERFDWHIETCLIEARQKSAGGKVVFRYRFAVVPIQDFRLNNVTFNYGLAVADYGFQSILKTDVTNSQGKKETVNAWGRYNARTLLKDEFLCIRIETVDYGKVTEAKLALAALDIELPETLEEISRKRPVCLADALSLGPSEGNFKVSCCGWRYNRAVMVRLGDVPLFFKELKQPGDHEFNLFRDIKEFVQADDAVPSDKPLTLSIIYGDDVSEGYLKPAWTDLELIRCKEGVGIEGWTVLAKDDGSQFIRFSGKPLCDLRLEFKRKSHGDVMASVDIAENATDITLPEKVTKRLNTQKRLFMNIVPVSLFDEPEYEYAAEFLFERQKQW